MKTMGSKLVTFYLTLFISSITISNAAASDDFSRLYAQAKTEMNSEFGGFYARQLNSSFFENQPNIFDDCSEKHKKSKKQLFSAVFEIDSDGTIKAFHLSKETDFAACLKSRFVGLEVPMPPYDGYLSPFNWGLVR